MVESRCPAASRSSKPCRRLRPDQAAGQGPDHPLRQAVALQGVNLEIREHEIFGIIGPANAGKTSFLKAINRMDMFTPGMRVDGEIRFNGRDTRRLSNVYALRRRIGVVFPLPVGLPMTVYDNVALAPRLARASRTRPSWT